MALVYLLLGSNKGEREIYIERAIRELTPLFISRPRLSPLYESEPWGFDSQKWFLNIALEGETLLPAELLLTEMLKIEEQLGRVRPAQSMGYESREIDIDLIFYSDQIINTPNLVVPHPRMHERRFVLEPLNSIIPEFIHPILKKRVGQLLAECPDLSRVSIITT